MEADYLYIKEKKLIRKVSLSSITFIKSTGNYCAVHSDKEYSIKISLSKLLKRLPLDLFIRIHQSHVVQKNKIEVVDLNNNSLMIGEHNLPIGPTFRHQVLQSLQEYII